MRATSPLITAALVLLLGTGAAAQGTPTIPADFRREFLGQFDASTAKLIALAEAMPADRFSWSPGPGVMPVAQVYAHIARYNFQYPATSMGIPAPTDVDLDRMESLADKARVVEVLRRSVEHVKRAVEGMPEGQLGQGTTLYGRSVAQWAVLFQLLAHMNEHLGQSIAYARMNGVVPPWSR